MTALLLLCSVALLVPATVGVFTVAGHGHPARAGRVVAAAVLVALGALGVAALLGAGPVRATVVSVLLGGSVLAWWPLARAWAARGIVAWALTVDTGVAFSAYVVHWMLTTTLTPAGAAAGALLWLVELFVFVLALGYVWELVDVLARRDWRRGVDLDARPRRATRARPFVSLHVPTHNEPPDLVIATLERLLALDYDDFEILLVDNNTDDPALWRPVEEFCAGQPARSASSTSTTGRATSPVRSTSRSPGPTRAPR